MKDLEQTLQDLRINEQDHDYGNTWHSLTVKEIEEIKRIFVEAGFKPPKDRWEMTQGEIQYERFKDLFDNYVGTAKDTNQFDKAVYNHILHLARVAAHIDNE